MLLVSLAFMGPRQVLSPGADLRGRCVLQGVHSQRGTSVVLLSPLDHICSSCTDQKFSISVLAAVPDEPHQQLLVAGVWSGKLHALLLLSTVW